MKKQDMIPENGNIGVTFDAAARPVITLDIEKYQAYLEGSELSDMQKEEFLQSLWSIIVSFVELGFGVHPLQEICGQNTEPNTSSKNDEFCQVDSKQPEMSSPLMKAGPPGGLEEK